MAITGENGTVKYSDDSGAVATAVGSVRSWSVEHTKDALDTSKMGSSARTFISSLHQFTGTMDVLYDPSAHEGLGIFDPSSDATLHVEFHTAGAGGIKYEGDVIVTSVSRSVSYDDLASCSVSFQGTGPLVEATV
tara:strand:+ start:11837 stop:12241 length:405 start_codon:yes stop_codon:yes gene_type:complete